MLDACSGEPPLPAHPIAASPRIAVQATPVPLSASDPGQDRVGAFVYAGGLELTSTDTSRLHGLSDLRVWPDGRLTGGGGATLDELKLAAPLAVDNLEGVAALPQPDGSIRFYLISDDNFSRLQRPLLLAFDWRPQQGRKP